MENSGRARWLGRAVVVGMLYLAVGQASIAIAGAAASVPARNAWRLSAFAASAVLFAAHIADEHFRARNAARQTAWHASLAVALGGFGLALAANLRELASAAGYRPRMLVALVAWPLLTALPAFLVALAVAAALGVKRR